MRVRLEAVVCCETDCEWFVGLWGNFNFNFILRLRRATNDYGLALEVVRCSVDNNNNNGGGAGVWERTD